MIERTFVSDEYKANASERLRISIACTLLNFYLSPSSSRMEFRCDGSPLKVFVCARYDLFDVKVWKDAEHLPEATIDQVTIKAAGDWILSKTDKRWRDLSKRIRVKDQSH